MESSILKQITRFLQEQKKHKRWAVVFVCLAMIVGFGTVTALKMMGQAMTHKEKRLICQLAIHQHTDECYDEEQNLICGYADYVVHKHNDDCYAEDGTLTCTLPEIEEHTHTEECYSEQETVICGLEESAGHQHTESCYTQQLGELQCGLEEHQHTDDCYDEEGSLICGLEEHQHTDDCYAIEEVLTCTIPEGEGAHTHTDECYEVQKTLVCDKPEVQLHTHTDECYEIIDPEKEYSEENRRLICGQLQVEEHVHTEDAGCFEIVEVTAVGEPVEDVTADEPEIFTTDLDGEDEEETAVEDETAAEDREETDPADDEETEEKTYELVKTYAGDGYIVTAEYNGDANIPEEAELIAEQITVDSDEEYYAEREAEYRKSTGDKNAVMKALFKIGFYVDGEEIEPETAVKLTIQLLNANGLPEGTPITVVHFAEKGTEVLDGSEAESGSTSFEMESFSDVAIGFKKADAKKASVEISESYVYTDKVFRITFNIEGEAKLAQAIAAEEDADSEDATDISENVSGEESESAEGEQQGESVVGEDTEAAEGNEIISSSVENNGDFSLETEGEDTDSNLEFRVVPLDENSEEYKAAVTHANNLNDGSELLVVRALSYSLYYKDIKLDLGDCQVTAEIEPAEALSEQVKESVPEAVAYLREEGEIAETPEDPSVDEMQTEVIVRALRMVSDTDAEEAANISVSAEEPEGKMKMVLDTNTAVVYASGQPNPKFTVQYYANLEVVAYNDPALRKVIGSTSYTNELPVIDTTGGKLPANGGGSTASPNGNEIRNLYVDMTSGKLQTKTELTEVYSSRPFEYHKAPTINYMNALVENPNYELKEVWVLKEGKEADSTERDDWDVHTYSGDLHFTNREVSAASGEYVLISDGATLRFVYDTTDNDNEFATAFYDYDIGDGMIYSTQLNAQKQTGGKPTSTQGSGTYHMHTNQSGINSPGNYTGSGAKLAFGNANTGSGLQHELWGGNLLNKANQTQSGHPSVTGSYKGCTFGLVTGLVDGKVQYAGNVNAPNLFNDGSAAGKTSYDNGEFSLTFNRVGDTFTLTTVNGTGTGDLDTFNHPSPNASTVHNHIWTNNFWPMDSAASFGTDGHDMKFGDYTNRENYKFAGQAGSSGGSAAANGTFPWSDDGEDHNSYFGMHYNVEFDLVEDYVGPLEYYFFGDDDMWVFLDGRLVCDIGGVHSSVGEYVNLWDYLEKGSEESAGKHTLSFFYTERGESGSTCWMQFTLPTVSSLTPETSDEDYGHLKIEKTVTQINEGKEEVVDNNDEFTFTVHFTDKDGNNLPDDYSYVKYDKDGNEIGSDLIIWDGGEFTLKNGEYIIVKFLPQGTKYEIVEANTAITVIDNTSEESKVDYFTDITVGGKLTKDLDDNKKAEGEIPKGDTSEVKYNNKCYIYNLPKTGGVGPIIYTMAGVLIVLFGAGFMYRKKVRERRV